MLPGSTWHRGIDLIAVERAMSEGAECPPLTEAEQRYVVQELTEQDWSARLIAQRLGIAERTVTRWRSEHEEQS